MEVCESGIVLTSSVLDVEVFSGMVAAALRSCDDIVRRDRRVQKYSLEARCSGACLSFLLLRNQRQEGCKSEASLRNLGRPCVKVLLNVLSRRVPARTSGSRVQSSVLVREKGLGAAVVSLGIRTAPGAKPAP